MNRPAHPLRLIAAFAAIYVIWGSTYLAIRVAIESIPPFLMIGTRYVVAGAVLYVIARLTGVSAPERRHWWGALALGGLLITAGNGGVVWAEQVLDSSFAALVATSSPFWIVLLDWWRPGGRRPTARVALGLGLGFLGLTLLLTPGEIGAQGAPAVMAILGAAFCWAIGTVHSRKLTLPDSPILSTAICMLAGGLALILVAGLNGEVSEVDLARFTSRSMLALAYLTVFGSLVAFTAYVWLLGVASPARISTHAFVNPVVAVLLGWWLGNEPIGLARATAAAIIVAAVIVISLPGASASGRQPLPIEGDDDEPDQLAA